MNEAERRDWLAGQAVVVAFFRGWRWRSPLAAGPEVAEIETTAGTKRGELLGAATPKRWLDWASRLRRTFDLDVLAFRAAGVSGSPR